MYFQIEKHGNEALCPPCVTQPSVTAITRRLCSVSMPCDSMLEIKAKTMRPHCCCVHHFHHMMCSPPTGLCAFPRVPPDSSDVWLDLDAPCEALHHHNASVYRCRLSNKWSSSHGRWTENATRKTN